MSSAADFQHFGASPDTKRQMALSKQARLDAQVLGKEEPSPLERHLAAFTRAQKAVPTNQLGLPIVLLRMDMIPEDYDPINYTKLEQGRLIDNASVEIEYTEGFPAFTDATPIWGPIANYEPSHAFELFNQYLSLADAFGVRQLHALFLSAPNQEDLEAQRNQAYQYFIMYSWAARAKAFDLFQQAADKKLREKRILNSTNAHFLQAEKIMGPLMEALFAVDEEDGTMIAFADMQADKLVATWEKLVNIQRRSIGMDQPVKLVDNLPVGASTETLMRIRTEESQDPLARKESGRAQIEEVLMSTDANKARLAQQLITELNRDEEAEKTVQQVELVPESIAEEIAG